MNGFNDVDRRLVMRYANPDTATFSFNKVRTITTDESVFNLANALASVQREQPNRITSVVTRQLI